MAHRPDVAADRIFWERSGHPGTVVVPFLLIGGSGAPGDERWPRLLLCGLLNQLNSVDWPGGHDDDLDAFRAALPAGSFDGSPGDELMLSTLLVEVVSQLRRSRSRPETPRAMRTSTAYTAATRGTRRSAMSYGRPPPNPHCCEAVDSAPDSMP